MTALITTWLRGLGQQLAIGGVAKFPTSIGWNFVSGVTATYNPTTGYWDLTVSGGGGGSGHTIQDEGVSLTARTILNFVGPNVTVTDTGGKTQVSIPAVNLGGSGVTGSLPVGKGGTGQGGLGSALQVLRTKADLSGTEWATFSATPADGSITLAKLAPDALPTKPRVLCVATTNIASTSGLALTIDGIPVNSDGHRVLLTAQTSPINNGIWVAHSGAWTRAVDMPAGSDASSTLVQVQQSTSGLADTLWTCQTDGAAVVGTDVIGFERVVDWSKLPTAIGNRGFTGLKSLTYNGEVDVTATNVDWSAGQLAKKLGLTTDVTLTFTDPPGPCYVDLHISQDGTGGRKVTLPGSCVALDGIVWQPNPNASTHSFLTLRFESGTYYYYGRAAESRIVTETTTARTLGLGDAGAYIRTTNGSAVSITVPPNSSVAFQLETLITGIQAGAGQITFVQGAGVTINKRATRNLKTAEQYSSWALKKVGTDTWDLVGSLEVA